MTINETRFPDYLQINRNKLRIILLNIINSAVDAIIREQNLQIPFKTRYGLLSMAFNTEKFELYLDTIIEIYMNIESGNFRTKRDVYYGNSNIFKSQRTLDRVVDNIAKNFQVPRDALNIVGSAKGLFFGELEINGIVIEATNINMIPRREEVIQVNLKETKFVLVVEKDAVMQVIVDRYSHLKAHLGSFIVLSGKGFPCLRTKQFVKMIADLHKNIPIYILVDNDPYGIDICLNYASNTNEYEMDGCRSVQYIGVTHLDIDKHGNPDKLETLTKAEVKRLETVLEKARQLNRSKEENEILFMQNNLKKAEMEALYSPDVFSFCDKYLLNKLQGLLIMEEEDLALKRRLQVDERVLRRFSKKILANQIEGLQIDLEQMLLQMDKNEIIIKTFENDWKYIDNVSQKIESTIKSEEVSVANCKNELIEARNVLKNRQEYDLIANEILEYQISNDLENTINEVNSDIQGLLDRIEEVEKRTDERHAACSQVLESIQILLETVGDDIKEFK